MGVNRNNKIVPVIFLIKLYMNLNFNEAFVKFRRTRSTVLIPRCLHLTLRDYHHHHFPCQYKYDELMF